MSTKRRVRYSSQSNQVGYKKLKQPTKKASNGLFRKILRLSIYATIIFLLFYSVIISSLFRIKSIEVSGNQTLSEDAIKNQVLEVINGSLINQNILFVPGQTIETNLKKNNYQISKAKIERKLFNTVKITITEQKPSILWRSGNTLSVFASNGHAYSGEPSEQLKKSLPTVVDTSNLPVKTGEKSLTESFVSFVSELHARLPEKGVVASEYQVQETTTDLYVVTQAGYKIRFDTTRSVNDQLTDLVAVLDELKKQGKKPAEYIDLRINGRVFYK